MRKLIIGDSVKRDNPKDFIRFHITFIEGDGDNYEATEIDFPKSKWKLAEEFADLLEEMDGLSPEELPHNIKERLKKFIVEDEAIFLGLNEDDEDEEQEEIEEDLIDNTPEYGFQYWPSSSWGYQKSLNSFHMTYFDEHGNEYIVGFGENE